MPEQKYAKSVINASNYYLFKADFHVVAKLLDTSNSYNLFS